MRRFPILLAALLIASPALAATTPWQDVAPGARLRLVSSDVKAADGTTLVGLELDMPAGFTTYWRHPGESGIPTEIDTAGSQGVAGARIDWPFPAMEEKAGVLDYVYRGPTVLPITLEAAGETATLRLSVTMGICSEVCVPARAHFELPLGFAAEDPAESIRLRQAEAEVPIPWDGAAPAFAALTYSRATRELRLEAPDPAIDTGSLIAAAGDPSIVFDAPKKSPDGHALSLRLRGGGEDTGWAAVPVDVIFETRKGAYSAAATVRIIP